MSYDDTIHMAAQAFADAGLLVTDPLDNPVPGYKLAQLIRPARGRQDKPHVVAERYIKHDKLPAVDVALACFQRDGLIRKGLRIRCLTVSARDLGMVRLPG